MKLLFDEQLSPHLAASLQDLFPGSSHVHLEGLGSAADPLVWKFAGEHGLTIVSKDSDYVDLAIRFGHPPKVVIITLGNCGTKMIESLLRVRASDILNFGDDPNDSILYLP